MRWQFLILGILVLTVGCGGPGYRVAPVSGVVKLDNKPLANVHVNFQPIAVDNPNPGPGSYGKTDSEGRFTLYLVTASKGSGAVVGPHKVSISGRQGEQITREGDEINDAGNWKIPQDPVPEWYNTYTILQFEVPASGTSEAAFQLSSKKPKDAKIPKGNSPSK